MGPPPRPTTAARRNWSSPADRRLRARGRRKSQVRRAEGTMSHDRRIGPGTRTHRTAVVQHRSPALPRGFARRVHETFEPKDVAVIGLHATFEHHDAYSPAVIKAFIHEYRLEFPIALDSPNAHGPIPHTMDRYGMRGTPSVVLIDRSGLLRKHAFGVSDDLALGAQIGALAHESPATAIARNSAA